MNNLPATDMHTVLEAIKAQTANINTILGVITNVSSEVADIKTEQTLQGDRITKLEDEARNGEVTTREKRQIKKAVTRRVYELLGIPANKKDWDQPMRVYFKKYSHIFHSRCYAEVSRMGHLASPYEETAKKDYTDAIKDIEAWTPSNGITGLKKESDDNAIARKIAREQGY